MINKTNPNIPTFLSCMFNDLDDIRDGTDDEVKKELEECGVDIDSAKDKFLKLLSELKYKRDKNE